MKTPADHVDVNDPSSHVVGTEPQLRDAVGAVSSSAEAGEVYSKARTQDRRRRPSKQDRNQQTWPPVTNFTRDSLTTPNNFDPAGHPGPTGRLQKGPVVRDPFPRALRLHCDPSPRARWDDLF